MAITPAIPIVESGGMQRAPWTRLVCGYGWLANRQLLACSMVLALTLGIRAALLPWLPVPEPVVHDEFSYLLAADTYAHGRLTNPPHPFWQHFESFHILQQPTYASKYQPMQGLMLAFGQKFFGEPWIGVYLSTGLMCAAICWMLQGWIATDWALLGALMCVLRVGVLSYWMNSYQGGSVPGIGGALALGAVVRIWRRGQFAHSITWAVGLSILALSRPYDAAVVACATGALLLWFWLKSETPARSIWAGLAVPALIVLLLSAAGIAYNNYRVTGNALTLPYQVHDGQYAMVSMFTTMPIRSEPPYRHAVMRKFWADWNVGQMTQARDNPVQDILSKLYFINDLFFPFWLSFILLLLCPYDPDTAEERATVFLLGVALLMVVPLIAIRPHYLAAFAGVFYLRLLHSLSRLRSWKPWNQPLGHALAFLLAGLLICDGLGLTLGRDIFSRGIALRGAQFGRQRHTLTESLEQQPGKHLVLVRYAPKHDPQIEWVYNRADIDAARIVWAREMSPEQDRPFLKYFHDRRVWLLEPDRWPLQLTPYGHAQKGTHD